MKTAKGILIGLLFAITCGAFAAVGSKIIQSVTLDTLLSCEDQTLSSCWVSLGGSSANLTQATTSNQVKNAPGEVVGFFVNTTTSGTIRFWDQVNATCNSGAKGATITPAAGNWYPYPVKFSTGICVLTGGTGIDVTVVYR